MKFKQWFDSNKHSQWDNAYGTAREAWNYQQAKIEALKCKLAVRDAFIAGITYDCGKVRDELMKGVSDEH
jgi:hypothetical protein